MKLYRPTYKDKATGEVRETEHYYLRHRSKRYPLHVSDKRVAEAKAREMIAQLELGYDPRRHELAKTECLASLINIYRTQLQAGDKQKYQVGLRLTKVAEGVKATTLGQFTAEKVKAWIGEAGLARRTQAHYRVALRAFGGWLAKVGHTPRNPFEGLEQVRHIEADRRLTRRALSAEDFEKLVSVVSVSFRRYCKLSGRQRAALYRLVAGTGLRRAEAASLQPASFRLDAEPPHVVVQAAYTKNRKVAVQPLPSSLVPFIREFLQGLALDAPVWPDLGKGQTAKMIAGDLEEAGLPLEMVGAQFDFHALRGQYATRLAKAGVGLAAAQKLMRHSTPALTANVYTHLGLADLGKEVEKL